MFSEGRNDKLLGHLIVLLQYDWPKRENLFIEAVKKIQNQGSFKYACFFDYVIGIPFTLLKICSVKCCFYICILAIVYRL